MLVVGDIDDSADMWRRTNLVRRILYGSTEPFPASDMGTPTDGLCAADRGWKRRLNEYTPNGDNDAKGKTYTRR